MPNGNSVLVQRPSPTAQVALVTSESSGFRTTIYQLTSQETSARAASECAIYPGVSTRQSTGQVTGLQPSDVSITSMGTWSQARSAQARSYSLLNLPTGSLDLLSVRGTRTRLATSR